VADAFTPDWVEAAGELWPQLPPAPGAEGTVSLSISTGTRREVSLHWTYQDGRAVEGGAGTGGEPKLALTLAAADAPDVLSGQVEPSVAFMRGRLKAAGDGALLLAFLSSTTAEAFQDWRSRADALSLPS